MKLIIKILVKKPFRFFRKLVQLKLEKGQDFGDAILDNVYNKGLFQNEFETVVMKKELQKDENGKTIESSTPAVPSTSIFSEVKKQHKSLCVVADTDILKQYRQFWIKDDEDTNDSKVNFVETSSPKESISKACEVKQNYTGSISQISP